MELIFKISCEYIYCTEMYEGLNERADCDIVLIQISFFYKRYTKCTKMIMFDLGTGCH